MIITSRANPSVKRLCSLKEKKYRDELGLYLVEGFKMIREAFASGQEIALLAGTEEGLSKLGISFENTLAVSEFVLEAIADSVTPQGVVAAVVKPRAKPVFSGVTVLLDGVSDPGNFGTIIRTAAAVGVKNVIAVDCCDPYSPKAVRSSMSGIYFVSVSETTEAEALSALSGKPLIVADMAGEDVFSFDPPDEFCLVVGSEAHGVRRAFSDAAASVVALPMSDHSESLNAAVSLSVLLYTLTYGKGRAIK